MLPPAPPPQTIVNNESSEILRMLNTDFNAVASAPGLDLYPAALRPAIDAVNDWVRPWSCYGAFGHSALLQESGGGRGAEASSCGVRRSDARPKP